MSWGRAPANADHGGQGQQWPRSVVIGGWVCAPLVLILLVFGVVKLAGIGSDGASRTFPVYPVADVLRGELAWTAPAESTSNRLGWLAGTTLVYADVDTGQVTGVSTGDGAERWTYRLPPPVTEDAGVDRICASTRKVFMGTVAIAFQRELPGRRLVDCSGLVLLDVRTGKPVWETVRTNQGVPGLAFAGGRLVIADGNLTAYDLDSSKPLWTRGYQFEECLVGSVGGTTKVLAVAAECGSLRRHEAWTLDPATGNRRTRTTVGSKPDRANTIPAQIVSAEPLVIAYSPIGADGGETSRQAVSTLTDDRRKVGSTFQLPERARYDGVNQTVVVSGHRLVVSTEDGRLVCYDLYTGRAAWIRPDLAPDGHAEGVSSGRVFLAGSDGKVVYGVVADLSGRTGVFAADLESSVLTMLGPPLRTPFKRFSPPVIFLSGKFLYGVNSGEQFGAAFALR